MQIATLSYQYKPKENLNGDSRAKLRHRHTRTTLTNLEKKPKPRQSLYSDFTLRTNGQLPSITTNGERRNSMRIKGSSLPSSKLGESLSNSFNNRLSSSFNHRLSRSNSRLSINSDHLDARSRSITPTGSMRPTSKLVRMKFGYPIKIRPPDFYGPNKSEAELHLLEESFINDSIRSAHQAGRSSIIPPYNPLDDPHLRRFFQSPIVLDVVRKTLSVDPNNSYKPDRKLANVSSLSKRSTSNGAYDRHNDDYLRIVKTRSSGYAKLNGYDCIPSTSTARQYNGHFNDTVATVSDSRLQHTATRDKLHRSTSSSMTSFPANEKKSRRYEKSKQLKPLATSSAIRHNPSEQKSGLTVPSVISQD